MKTLATDGVQKGLLQKVEFKLSLMEAERKRQNISGMGEAREKAGR